MKRMISRCKWKPNERIPKLKTIADSLNVSIPTVRNAIKVLEYNKTIQNYDSLGYYVLSDILTKNIKNNRTKELIQKASVLITTATALHSNANVIGRYAISFDL